MHLPQLGALQRRGTAGIETGMRFTAVIIRLTSRETKLDLFEAADPVAPDPRAQLGRGVRDGVDGAARGRGGAERAAAQHRLLQIGLREPGQAHVLERELDALVAAEEVLRK